MGEEPSFFTPEPFNRREARIARRFFKKVAVAENGLIDARSQAHFDANFFDTVAIRRWEAENGKPASGFKHEIMRKYDHQTTMYGRFALFLSQPYFPYLRAMDLGKTRDAQDSSELDELRDQYRVIRSAVEQFGASELPREKSEAAIHFRHDGLVTENHKGQKNVDTPMWLIGERNRTLLQFRYGKSGDVVSLQKRMTFGARQDLPAHLPYAEDMRRELANDDGKVRNPEELALIEDALDQGHPLLPGIRTLYFIVRSKLKS